MEDLLRSAMNVHDVNGVRNTEMHTAEPLGSESTSYEFAIALKS